MSSDPASSRPDYPLERASYYGQFIGGILIGGSSFQFPAPVPSPCTFVSPGVPRNQHMGIHSICHISVQGDIFQRATLGLDRLQPRSRSAACRGMDRTGLDGDAHVDKPSESFARRREHVSENAVDTQVDGFGFGYGGRPDEQPAYEFQLMDVGDCVPVYAPRHSYCSVLGILTVVEGLRPHATFFIGKSLTYGIYWVSLTVSFNVLITLLICGRLLSSYLNLRRIGGTALARERLGVIAILVESAFPFSACGVVMAVLYGIGSPAAVGSAEVWGVIVGLSPQLIILRVAMGRAVTSETLMVVPPHRSSKTRGATGGIYFNSDEVDS
ncbi:hypothetical protein NLJ89_g6130 [Agrocybe chaxingu]|uniref:Uncharacterized protein n=1 Tax=Agrocybe chaxingu TaxID=84603 RepID=A0A9W8JYV9_9AGAR|nr:hypothetical protein NLJ89_g6130 [Agrocybe chaxingu]